MKDGWPTQGVSIMSEVPILRATQISKHYPGVQALDKVDFELQAGEVRALLGKNGAGKSTFVKILSGAIEQDSGDIFIDGQLTNIRSPTDAFNAGIATVYQEMSLVMGLTVAENILLGRWPKSRILGWQIINQRQCIEKAREALEMTGVDLDPRAIVRHLSVPEQQIVEIAKAASFRPKVLILDEPTSALPEAEVDHLVALVRRLAERGVAIIYVSHRLQEVPRVADSLTVLRDGFLVGTIPVEEASPERIATMMIGSEWTKAEVRQRDEVGHEVLLSVRDLNRKNHLHDISFDLRTGEVLGIAGLLGSGRTELLRALFGLDHTDSGTITIEGQEIRHQSPRAMKGKGIGMTPEDRKAEGVIAAMSVGSNLTLSSLNRISRYQVISIPAERDMASEMADALLIQTPSLDVKASSLSGGNQQKVVIGRWLNSKVKILLMDEPTRGIDIQAKEQVYKLVRDLANQGISVIFVSSEIDEVLAVSDRILVMNQGYIVAEMPAAEAGLEQVLALAMEEEIANDRRNHNS
jgi:ribose transport system ATP-binding protein